MDEGGASRTLPEDLMEKIVAMMPFPSLFKARLLSKSWLKKFSSISSQNDDEEVKSEVSSFHKQVALWSKNWETFCPVFIGKGNCIAFDPASRRWRKLPSLSCLPENLVLARANLQIEGALLYGFARPEKRSRKKELYVSNIFTGSWKQLPPRPNAGASVVLSHKLVSEKSDMYKVIMFCREDHHGQLDRYSAHIYHSKVDAWSSKKLKISSDFFKTSTVFLNGVLYMVADTNPRDLLAFNVKDETMEEFTLSFTEEKLVAFVNLVVCNGTLMMIVTVHFHKCNQLVLRVDLESRRLVEVGRGPPEALHLGEITTEPVSNGNCIFFGAEECSSRIVGAVGSSSRAVSEGARNRVLAYNVRENEWSCFPAPLSPAQTFRSDRRPKWSASAFQLELGPFAAV